MSRWRPQEGRIPTSDSLNVKISASRRQLAVLLKLLTVKSDTLANLRQLNSIGHGFIQHQRYRRTIDTQKVTLALESMTVHSLSCQQGNGGFIFLSTLF